MTFGYKNAANAYKTNSVNYASKEQLLLMLVDGAVKFAEIARQGMIDNQIQKAHNNIIKTQNIFFELIATLDVSAAGEWGSKLMSIYQFIVDRLGQANIKKSIEIMNEVIPLIQEVRDTWYEASKISKVAK
ncbi:flagellar export chaperone FliS [Oceanirhabdus sp. W0125-5]|uniref:flagellar export chaperone FliS n=1 Tax=Oceanirhabdus sp. W0125-5 TaxID=2999116 RepID=UPI0022F2F279|nr:flagellar export chaperone FliS [Oceanirhabdus sp. W0125-5]WBW95466.1 flagellar export chaperone FliS [Oceanirhabdus sp. W0125-5]